MTAPSALSEILGWSAFLLACALLAAGILAHRTKHARSAVEPTKSAAERCSTTACRYPASILVRESDDLGGDLRLVCVGCADEGSARLWWERTWGVAS